MNIKTVYKSILGAFGYTDRIFWLISASFFLGLASSACQAGFSLTRWGIVLPPLQIAIIFSLLALSGLLLIGTEQWWRVYLYIALFGTVFGAVLSMRAVIMSRYFSGPLCGRLMGLQQSILALAIAGGPFVAGALRDVSGSYTIPWIAFTAMFATAIPVILAVRW